MIAIGRWISGHSRSAAAVLLLAAAAALWVGGAQPFAVNLVPSPWDKLAHCVVFAIIGAAIAVLGASRHWPLALAAAACATLLGAIDEWHQLMLPGRNGGWDDLAADALGACIGAGIASMRARFRPLPARPS